MSTKSYARMALAAVLALALVALLLPALASATPSHRVAGTEGESFVIKSDGTLWSWGGNASGNLGVGDQQPQSMPVQVGSATTWTSVIEHPGNGMLGLQSDGSLWSWGLPSPSSPALYSAAPAWAGPWQQVSAGGATSPFLLLLKNGGELWACGDRDDHRRGPAP